jgi:LysM repeat protein
VLEEVIFRGLIQQASLATYGRFGITFVAILFAILHVGYKSFLDVIFVLVVAMIFGLVVQRTGSLLGVSISHSLTNICLFLVFPFFIGTSTLGVPEVVPQTPTPSITLTQLQKYFFETPTSTITPVYLETELSKTQESPTETTLATQESTKTPTQGIEVQTPTQICGKPRGWVIYVVQSGDTLFKLSQTFNVSVSDLQNANCLTSTVIIAGDKLYVPNVVTNTPIPSDTSPPTSTTAPSPSSTFTLTTTPTEIPTGTATPSETPTISPTP